MESEKPPSAGWYNFLGWVDANRKRVLMGGAIVVIVGSVAAILLWRHSERETEAAQALGAIKHNPTEPAAAGLGDQFMKVANEYAKTPAGGQALLRAGAAYFDAGQFQQAQDAFGKFLQSYGETPWVPQAQYGLAACFEAQGRTADAITKYNDFLKNYSSDAAADEARFSLVRLYEKANQPGQAIDVLTKMTNGVPPFSPIISEVQERLKAIYARNPTLIPAQSAPRPGTFTPSMLTNFIRQGTNIPIQIGTGAPPRVARPPNLAPPQATGTAAPKIELQAPPQPAAPAK